MSARAVRSRLATGIDGATGLLVDGSGRILAVSFGDGAVYDISAGGDYSAATAFAFGFGSPRNLLELATGEILLADQSPLGRAVFDITAGGDFSSATPFASGFPPDGPYDLVQNGAGRIFASTDAGVFDITDGGNFSSATPHASGRVFAGLAVDGVGRLLASELESDDVYDITAGGNYAAATPFASNLDGFSVRGLDRARQPPPPASPRWTQRRGSDTRLAVVGRRRLGSGAEPARSRPGAAPARRIPRRRPRHPRWSL